MNGSSWSLVKKCLIFIFQSISIFFFKFQLFPPSFFKEKNEKLFEIKLQVNGSPPGHHTGASMAQFLVFLFMYIL